MDDDRLLVVGAIFIKDGKVFAAKRGASKYPYTAHKYEFAGGKIEKGEDGQTALKRELREEMALEADITSLYMTIDHDYPDFKIRLITYLARMTSNYTLLEHESAAWLPIEGLDAADWASADQPILNRLKEDFAR